MTKLPAATKLGILVGEDNWTFFREIHDDLASHYQTEIYHRKTYHTPLLYGRLNRWALAMGLRSMLHRNEICFFEWASDLLMHASHMPKRSAIVTRLHSFELFTWAPKVNWTNVDRVILVSKAMQRMFGDLYPEHSHKTKVVYNGRALDRFQPPVQRDFQFRLGMLGAIAPIKRVYEVILMLSHLTRQGFYARLHIAGSPQADLRYGVALHRLVEVLDLQDSVIFDGYITEVPTWLQDIDIFISNSYWEGQQAALIEAMATGCYCLSHAWAGAEEMLPPNNLYLSEVELEQKIIEYYEMPDSERQSCQAQLRSIACEKFDVERTKAQIRQVIEEVGDGTPS